MLLSLVLPAFALTVPLRATFKETVEPGEQALASGTITAVAAAYSTTSGARFTVSDDELTANKREASGSGGLSFEGSPADSVRSWAIYYIAADGEVLSDPDIVTMSFDSSGTGNVAAGTGKLLAASDVVTLDPSGFGVQAKNKDGDKDDTGIIIDVFLDGDTDGLGDIDNMGPPVPPGSPTWAYFVNDTYKVTLLDSSGRVRAEHSCTLDATPKTVAGTANQQTMVGQCTDDPSGTEVRRLQLKLGEKHMHFTVDVASPLFAEGAAEKTCDKAGVCTEGATALGGKIEVSLDGSPLWTHTLAVNETAFDLPFSFTEVSDGLDGSVAIDIYTPTAVTWTVKDGVATATDATGVVASFNLDDVGLTPTGDITAKDWTAESAAAPKADSTEPLSLSTASSTAPTVKLQR